jgi:hypothetical protein
MKKLADFLRELPQRATVVVEEVFPEVAVVAHSELKFGGPITGAPGQPVDTGNLRNSVSLEFETPTLAHISIPVEYAEAVEDGVGPHGPVKYGKSGVGGSHSMALVILGIQPITDTVVARRKANA